jgi:hypothetical protein
MMPPFPDSRESHGLRDLAAVELGLIQKSAGAKGSQSQEHASDPRQRFAGSQGAGEVALRGS